MGRFVEDKFWDSIFTALAQPGASELVANDPQSFFLTDKGQKRKIETPTGMNERSYLDSIRKNLIPLVHSEEPFDPTGYLFEGHYTVPGVGGFEGRCHIMLPPVTMSPRVTLTKIASSANTIETIAASGSMSTEMMNFLVNAVKSKLTIVLSGQSGAGKTTTLQALTKYFDPQDRVGVGEDIPELKLAQPNVFYLHTVPMKPGFDPGKVAELSWVVKQFLRMRPDRAIIGETRGKEFADFLVAANSGMSGSLTTLHADDPAGALDKMTRFALQGSVKQPIRSINKEIGAAVDLVVQLARINGKHRMTHIEEITTTVGNSEDAKLSSQTLYKYDRATDTWEKPNMMTEKLQKKIEHNGGNVKPFLQNPVGSRQAPHQGAAGSANGRPANGQGPAGGGFNGNPFGGRKV